MASSDASQLAGDASDADSWELTGERTDGVAEPGTSARDAAQLPAGPADALAVAARLRPEDIIAIQPGHCTTLSETL